MDNDNRELQEIKRQVQELQQWKDKKERQQIENPLDVTSKSIARRNFIIPTGGEVVPVGIITFTGAWDISVNDRRFILKTAPSP